ncbi:LanC-like protein 3 [Temnothorax longispinosus]|uniref:LanC-like protein 3 n=1 Tax=Temnothorax longispinosus TaxID=300112 RepID=A0A4S2JQH1_9HYME|nr:LanC-like protein 3 [Temnothorax longispinosus]
MSRRSRYFVNEYCAREEEIANDLVSIRRDINNSQCVAKDNLRKILRRIIDKEPPERAEADGGLYVGASGISYAFIRLAECAALEAETSKKHLSLAECYLRSSLSMVQRRSGTGFLLDYLRLPDTTSDYSELPNITSSQIAKRV